MAVRTTYLFLHGGPGLTAGIERRWFGDSLPVVWWDQPKLAADEPQALETLVAAASVKALALAEAMHEPIGLLAHSFGAHIACGVADAHPHAIGRVTLLAGGGSLPDQLLRMGQASAANLLPGHALRDAVDAAFGSRDLNSMLGLVSALAAAPDWVRRYFGPNGDAAFDRYQALSPEGPEIDPSTFLAGLRQALAARPSPCRNRFEGSVSVLFGRDDPMLDMAADRGFWRVTFPQADIRTTPGGHMLHLELPPESWLSGASAPS